MIYHLPHVIINFREPSFLMQQLFLSLYKALMTFMEHCYGYGSLMGWVWHHYVITKENDICILAYCHAIRLWFCQITATLLDRLLQVHSQEMFPTGLCWSSPRDVCFFIFSCLFNLLIRHGFVYSTGDEEVVVILSFSHVSQLHSDRHVKREEIRGVLNTLCVYYWEIIPLKSYIPPFNTCRLFLLHIVKNQLNWTAICKNRWGVRHTGICVAFLWPRLLPWPLSQFVRDSNLLAYATTLWSSCPRIF